MYVPGVSNYGYMDAAHYMHINSSKNIVVIARSKFGNKNRSINVLSM